MMPLTHSEALFLVHLYTLMDTHRYLTFDCLVPEVLGSYQNLCRLGLIEPARGDCPPRLTPTSVREAQLRLDPEPRNYSVEANR